jgi:hypothetical protein
MAKPDAPAVAQMAAKRLNSTVARIAGNIASGLASKEDMNSSGYRGAEGVAEWMQSVTMLSVGLARASVEEVNRTQPEDSEFAGPEPKAGRR